MIRFDCTTKLNCKKESVCCVCMFFFGYYIYRHVQMMYMRGVGLYIYSSLYRIEKHENTKSLNFE